MENKTELEIESQQFGVKLNKNFLEFLQKSSSTKNDTKWLVPFS